MTINTGINPSATGQAVASGPYVSSITLTCPGPGQPFSVTAHIAQQVTLPGGMQIQQLVQTLTEVPFDMATKHPMFGQDFQPIPGTETTGAAAYAQVFAHMLHIASKANGGDAYADLIAAMNQAGK